MTKQEAVVYIRLCWDEFSPHSCPSLTSTELSEIDDMLRLIENFIEEEV